MSKANGANGGAHEERAVRAVRAVAGYVRVSTDSQRRSGLGLADQRMKIAAMATIKDWPEPVIYADEGVSGTKETADRAGLARLMADVRAGTVDAIIVNSLDRLARKARLTLEVVEELNAHGVQFVSCKESVDTTTAAGRMVIAVLAAMAQFERDLISERTIAAIAANDRLRGERGGRLPYGYDRDGRDVEVDTEAADVVRLIFRLKRAGLSLRAIAEALNTDGHPTPYDARCWWASSVRSVLDNAAAYKGGKRGASDLRWPAILKGR